MSRNTLPCSKTVEATRILCFLCKSQNLRSVWVKESEFVHFLKLPHPTYYHPFATLTAASYHHSSQIEVHSFSSNSALYRLSLWLQQWRRENYGDLEWTLNPHRNARHSTVLSYYFIIVKNVGSFRPSSWRKQVGIHQKKSLSQRKNHFWIKYFYIILRTA